MMSEKQTKHHINSNKPKKSHSQKSKSAQEPPSPEPIIRMFGYVKFFNSHKGYGFIIPDAEAFEEFISKLPADSSYASRNGRFEEVFVHHTAIRNSGGFRSLAEGEYVEFECCIGPKGIQAANVSGFRGESVIGDPNAGRIPNPYHPHFPLDETSWYMPPPYAAYAQNGEYPVAQYYPFQWGYSWPQQYHIPYITPAAPGADGETITSPVFQQPYQVHQQQQYNGIVEGLENLNIAGQYNNASVLQQHDDEEA